MAVPCPLCDVDRWGFKPPMAFAYGVSLGAAFIDMHGVTELMCGEHRPLYVMAMTHASVAMATRGDEEEPFAEEGPLPSESDGK
jgi:hypothetical protein